MSAELNLYISSAHEQDAECEQIGRLLAEKLPTIRWRIWRTPLYGDTNPDCDVIGHCQFYVIILGTDLVAPMGVEFQMAKEAGAFTIGFRDLSRFASPSAEYFARYADVAWQEYTKLDEFIPSFERILLRQLIDGTPGYGLALEDLEQISAQLQQIESLKPAPQGTRSEAGKGGIILAEG